MTRAINDKIDALFVEGPDDGAVVNAFARQAGAEVMVIDVGVSIPLASLPRNTAPIRTRVTPPDEILGFANRIAAENEALKNTDAALVAAAQARLEAELLAAGKTTAIAERDAATAELAATTAARDALAGEVAGLRAHLSYMKTHPVAFLTRKLVERFPRAQR